MFKKIISIILTVVAVCSLAVSVYADEPDCLTNGHTFVDPPGIMKGFDGEIQGFPVKVSIKYCSKCKFYFHECNVLGIQLEYMSLTGFTGIDGELQAFLFTQIGRIMGKNATATQFQAGGGSASPGGVGRNPSGYAGEGTPNISPSGSLYIVATPYLVASTAYQNGLVTFTNAEFGEGYLFLNPKGIVHGERLVREFGTSKFEFRGAWKITAPYDGIYYWNMLEPGQDLGYYNMYSSKDSKDNKSRVFSKGQTTNPEYKYGAKVYAKKGDIVYWIDAEYYYGGIYTTQLNYCEYNINPLIISCEPDTSTIVNQTNITINNNTFNGNIYVDNTNKLTYIYPQYTVNNETKISNNPIIYNEETKQYYVYDQTTNNYYYITYGDPAPTPTPSPSPDPDKPTPSPDPGGSTPDPDKPSPSPSPSTAPGGNSDKETGGNSFFNFIFGFGSDTGKDENGKKGIIWSLISLLVSCVTFVVGMGTAYSYLFPFLPPGLCTTIHICVLVLFLFAVIKFIRSFI